jgi:hypothetical protein
MNSVWNSVCLFEIWRDLPVFCSFSVRWP